MHHPCTTPCTDPCTAQLACQPNLQSDPTRGIHIGTTPYCCSLCTLTGESDTRRVRSGMRMVKLKSDTKWSSLFECYSKNNQNTRCPLKLNKPRLFYVSTSKTSRLIHHSNTNLQNVPISNFFGIFINTTL